MYDLISLVPLIFGFCLVVIGGLFSEEGIRIGITDEDEENKKTNLRLIIMIDIGRIPMTLVGIILAIIGCRLIIQFFTVN